MYAWFYNEETDKYEYVFEGYTAFVDFHDDHFGYEVWLGGEIVASDCSGVTLESAQVAASNALWDDYSGSVAVLDFMGA